MADYNYYDAVKDDVIDLINDQFKKRLSDFSSLEEFREALEEDAWTADQVTGNASGSYTFSTWEADCSSCCRLRRVRHRKTRAPIAFIMPLPPATTFTSTASPVLRNNSMRCRPVMKIISPISCTCTRSRPMASPPTHSPRAIFRGLWRRVKRPYGNIPCRSLRNVTGRR